LYLACRSSILGILGIIYCIFSRVQNYITSFTNYIYSSTTFSFSLCCIVVCFNCFCRLRVTIRFMFVFILPLFLGNFFCHKFKF
jgi:hypothetical protein